MENKETMAQLTEFSIQLNQLLMESGGEITEELEQMFAELDLKTRHKVDAYAFAMDKMESEAEYWKQRAERCMRVAKSFLVARERLNNTIKNRMIVDGTNDLVGFESKFKLVKIKPKMIINENILDNRFYKEAVLRKIDRSLIEDAIKQGESVPGVVLEPVYTLRPTVNKDRV